MLILRDVLGWRAKDCAELLDTTVAAVNCALQRARATLKEHLPAERGEWAAPASAASARWWSATSRPPRPATRSWSEALMHEDARFMMPPETGFYVGRDDDRRRLGPGRVREPDWSASSSSSLTRANRQPALANYVRKPGEESSGPRDRRAAHRGRAIVDIIGFRVPLFAAFGLPVVL